MKKKLIKKWDHDFITCYDHELDCNYYNFDSCFDFDYSSYPENDKPVTIPAGTFSFILN